MGLLKKLFVEEIPNETESYDVEATAYEESAVEVELEDVNTDTLIEDIYVQNELYDKTKSIFKVEELINSLPKEMVTETKKASVLAILSSFGLTVTDVTLDGDNRVEVLSGVLAKILGEGKNTVTQKGFEIEEHKKEIARLEKEISEQQTEMKISEDTINAEITRITELVKFIGGGIE
jgi:septal ring factor EnvC (AmiA/AmiB activator)